MKVRYTPRARDDLGAILAHLEHHSPQSARTVMRAMQKTVSLIGQFPESGRLVDEQATRVLPAGRYPYLIYWSIEAGEAWIVHVRHTSRRPWFPEAG